MANISHFTQTVNGISTTYDIHDANAIPRSGGAVLTSGSLGRTVSTDRMVYCGGANNASGASVTLYGKDSDSLAGVATIQAYDGTNNSYLRVHPTGEARFYNNGTIKNLAMQEDTVPRSGGAVMAGSNLYRTDTTESFTIGGGQSRDTGATIGMRGAGHQTEAGYVQIRPAISSSVRKSMYIRPDGTWTWDGTAVQITSDQRLKQQISEIDDKLLDAWEDVDLVQFKYNDAVEQKGDNARLHTGYVVQQIQKACESHGVDISQYGLFCHEEYPQETEEVEVEQADGTKTKERKVIREASEHYSLRYTEALIVECKYLRRCIERLTARIEELEKGKEQGASK